MQAFPYMDIGAGYLASFWQRSAEALRLLTNINLRLSRDLADDAVRSSLQLMNCRDPYQWMATAVKQMEPVNEHLRSYQDQVMDAITDTHFSR